MIFRKHFTEHRTRKGRFLSTDRELLRAVVDRDRTAFYGVLETVRELEEFSCGVMPTFVSRTPNQLAMAVPKESPYYGFFKFQLTRMKEVSTVDLRKRRWQSAPRCGNEKILEDVGLGMEKLISIFAALIAIYSVAVVLLRIEKCHRPRKKAAFPNEDSPEQRMKAILSEHGLSDEQSGEEVASKVLLALKWRLYQKVTRE